MRILVAIAFLLAAGPALAEDRSDDVVRAVQDNAAMVLGRAPSEGARAALERVGRMLATQDPAKARQFMADVDKDRAGWQAAGPVAKALAQERWLGKWAFTPAGNAIDQAADDIILGDSAIMSRDRASRTVLTRGAVEAFVDALDMVAVRGGRGALTPGQRSGFAAGVAEAYAKAPAPDKVRIAASRSRFLQLRENLERSTPAQQAELVRQARGVSDGPALVRMAYAYMNAAEDPAAPRLARDPGRCAGWMCDKGAVHLWAKANAMALLDPHL